MRRSGEVTGWAFVAEVDGVPHAGLAVGQAGLGPFTGAGPGGSLYTRAHVRGLAPLASLDELPFTDPVDARWCVHRDAEGAVAVLGPGGLDLAYDLQLDLPSGWLMAAAGTGAVVLVVSHVLPAGDDMVGVLTDETRRGMVCAGRVRFGPPGYGVTGHGVAGHGAAGHGVAGAPTLTYVLDPVSVLSELVLHVRDGVLSLDAAVARARGMERARRAAEAALEPEGRSASQGTSRLSAGAMLNLLTAEASRSREAPPELLHLYWRLTAEVAEECGAETVWREAALRTVESAAPVLAQRPDRSVFEDADALAGRLIERLEGSSDGSPDGSSGGSPGGWADDSLGGRRGDSPDPVAPALLAAARLRLALLGPEDLGGDTYAGGEGSVRAAQLAVDLYRSPLYRPGPGGEWPLRFDARLRAEAGHLLARAAERDDRESGPGSALRPAILAALAQVLAEDGGGEGVGARQHRGAEGVEARGGGVGVQQGGGAEDVGAGQGGGADRGGESVGARQVGGAEGVEARGGGVGGVGVRGGGVEARQGVPLGGGVDPETARAAFDALYDAPGTAPPDLLLFLLRAVPDTPPAYVDAVRERVFGSDVPAFLAAYGAAVAARTADQGLNLARERADLPLLRAALDWAGRLPFAQGPAHRRQQTEARLHALPDDPTECPGPDRDPRPLPDPLPADWSPAQRSAALLHAAAHARARRQPAAGEALLRRSGRGSGSEARLLTADLYRQAVEIGEPVSDRVPFPWGHSLYAALSYASLDQQDLAQACLLPVLQDLPNLSGDALKSAVYAIIVDVPNFDTSGAPALGEVLRDLVHAAVWQVTVEIETLPVALMLGLHQAGKGAEAGAWRRIGGPITRPAHIENYVAVLRAVEDPTASGGGATANLLNALDAPDAYDAPDTYDTGDAYDAGGADPGAESRDDDRYVRNLRRRISAFVDDELRARSAAFVDDRYLWARTGELLDERSVLLTWFLPTAVNGAAVLLAVTREGSAITVQLGDVEGGVPENAAAYADRPPVADLVEAVRGEVERDPLFGDVTPEGHRLLTGHELPLPTGNQWAAWRDRGKDRLLLWPHGALHYLPVALCSADADGHGGDGHGRLIADDWTVTTIAGLESLVPLDVPVRPRRTAVLASATGGVPYGLPAEPALDEHARAVAAAVGGVAVTGPAATRARLLAELATADVVHLAVHGTLDRDAPWLHCLHLAPDEDDDGRVFAHDFLEHDLSGVRLVTLAACESALGRFDRADNVRGVPAALITAGVQAVVGCLWAVRPEPAAYFYHHLHERAAQGESAERAFRAAQNATRARYPHYRDWGAFTFFRGRSEPLRDGNEGAAA
ncbi:CHAT domain-containing protein [Streptomyces bacillaris]|uniref:CHAT domain-containing protein n=1 Tax=Streptomyces bacillaris TaxID=68179 RepID=UPI0033648588